MTAENNYFKNFENDKNNNYNNCISNAYESVNVRGDHEISIMNSGNQTPLENNNL